MPGCSEASSVLTAEATSLPPLSLSFQNEGVGLNESKLTCTFTSCELPLAAGCEQAEITLGLENVPVPRLLGDTFLFLTTSPKPELGDVPAAGDLRVPRPHFGSFVCSSCLEIIQLIFDLSACSSRLKTAVGK